ncbi:MAG: hypothetical protein ACP5IM_01590 [Candidatus Bathyarchaeia archaeon]
MEKTSTFRVINQIIEVMGIGYREILEKRSTENKVIAKSLE